MKEFLIKDKQITTAEYLTCLRVLHVIRKQQAYKQSYINKDLLDVIRLVETLCPAKHLVDLLYK